MTTFLILHFESFDVFDRFFLSQVFAEYLAILVPSSDEWQHHIAIEAIFLRMRRILGRKYLLYLVVHLLLVSTRGEAHLSLYIA